MEYSKSDVRKAVDFNNINLIIGHSYNNTIFGSYTLQYQNRFWNGNLMDDFLLNYKVNNSSPDSSLSIGAFMDNEAAASIRTTPLEEKSLSSSNVIKLNKTKKEPKGRLIDVLKHRKSIRNFSEKKFTKAMISNILQYSLSAGMEIERSRAYPRFYPAGGGLYSIYLYLLVRDVHDLDDGIYKYQPYSHSLKLVNSEIKTDLNYYCNVSGIDVNNVHIMGFWEYESRKNTFKYGEMALPLALIECGHAMQTLDLVSYFFGVGTCQLGGFKKKIIENNIKVDGIKENVVSCFVMGGTL